MKVKKKAVAAGDRLPEGGKLSLWQRVMRQIRRNYVLYLFLLPTMIWYLLFRYLPMGGIYIAFTRYKGVGNIFDAQFVGLKWFESFFKSHYARTTFTNTLRLSMYSMATFPLPIIMALLINEISNERVKKVSQTIMYAPHFVSLVVLVSMMDLFLDSKGIINNAIEYFGGDPINFMGSAKNFPHVYIWSGVWTGLGWSCIIYLAALSGVDPGLHEAAIIDGCSRFRRIIHINLPAIAPTIVIRLIMRVGNLLDLSTEKTLLLRNDLNLATSETIGTFVYKRGLIAGDFSYAAAVGLFLNVINLIMLLIVNGISRKVSDTSLF